MMETGQLSTELYAVISWKTEFFMLIHYFATLLVAQTKGTRGRVVVKALCYQPEGRGFDTR
jgi:hypothetical protein